MPPRLLRGDLDAIVAKALRKEPEKRYTTVEALREDVARHLAGEAVAAREGARLYAASRFLRRNWLATAAAAAVLLAIVGGSLGVAWQARRAEYEARKATAVKDFVVGIFKTNGIDNPDGAKARATTAEQLLDLGAKRIDEEMHDVPDIRAELLGTIGGLYADLDLSERAIELLQKQIDTLNGVYEGQPAAPLAEAEVRLAAAQIVASRYSDAEKTLESAMRLLDELRDTNSSTRARALHLLGHVAYQVKPISDPSAEQYCKESLRILEERHPDDTLRVANLIELARISARHKNYASAESRFREVLALEQRPPFNSRPSDVAGVHLEYGDLMLRAQHYDEGERELRQAVALYLTQVGPDFPQTLRAQEVLAGLLFETGRLNEARSLMADTLRAFERVRGKDDLEWTADVRIYLARLLLARGEFEAAEQLFQQSVSSLRAIAPSSVYLPIALRWQAELLVTEGRELEAEKVIAEAQSGIAQFYGKNHERYAGTLLAEGNLYLAREQAQSAGQLYQRVMEKWPASDEGMPDSYVYSRLGLARVQVLQDRAGEAENLAGQVLKALLTSPQADSLRMQQAAARLWLGAAQRRHDDLSAAEENLRGAVTLREKMDDSFSPWLARARIELAECLLDRDETKESADLLARATEALSHHAQLGSQFRQPLRDAITHLTAKRAETRH